MDHDERRVVVDGIIDIATSASITPPSDLRPVPALDLSSVKECKVTRHISSHRASEPASYLTVEPRHGEGKVLRALGQQPGIGPLLLLLLAVSAWHSRLQRTTNLLLGPLRVVLVLIAVHERCGDGIEQEMRIASPQDDLPTVGRGGVAVDVNEEVQLLAWMLKMPDELSVCRHRNEPTLSNCTSAALVACLQ